MNEKWKSLQDDFEKDMVSSSVVFIVNNSQ